MGFFNKILGGGEAKGSSSQTKNPYAPTKEASDLLIGDMIPAYDQSRQAIAGGSPEQFVAGFNPEQQAAMQNLIDSKWLQPGMDAAQGMIGQGQGMVNTGVAGWGDIASGANQIGVDQDIYDSFYNEDLITGQLDAIGSDINRNLNERDLLNIDRKFSGIGGSGSSRAGIAEGVAIRGAQDQMGDISAQIRTNAHQKANQAALATSAQRQQAQANAFNNLLGSGMGMQQYGIGTGAALGQQGATNALNASTLEQQQRQAEIQGQLEKMQWDSQMPFMPINQANQALMPWASGFGTSSGTSKQDDNQGLLGKLAPYAGLAASFMSDKRLKTNIKQLGEVFGLPYYKWDWTDEAKEIVGDQGTFGWIAQEVQTKYPEAVSTNEHGFLQINTSAFLKALDKEMA